MVEALLVFLVIVLAMALTASYFYFKNQISKLELNIFHLETQDAGSRLSKLEQKIKDLSTELNNIKKLSVESFEEQTSANDIEKKEEPTVEITPELMHTIVNNKNIKIVREDVFSDEDSVVL